jgi:hypothetical protein
MRRYPHSFSQRRFHGLDCGYDTIRQMARYLVLGGEKRPPFFLLSLDKDCVLFLSGSPLFRGFDTVFLCIALRNLTDTVAERRHCRV